MHHFDSLASLAEVTAVKAHFRSVLWFLRQRRPPGLNPAQKAARALLLDELEAYAARGIFPLNTHSPGRQPTFIDEVGARCAVAHLLDFSGQEALALEVRDRMNFAALTEIVEEPRFVAWLEAAGFTREEIALVQPSYCELKNSDCVCIDISSIAGRLALVSYRGSSEGVVVSEVHRGLPGIEVGLRVVFPGDSPNALPHASTPEPNTERLAWVDAPAKNFAQQSYTQMAQGSLVLRNGALTCGEGGPSLPKEQAIKAVLSPSHDACRAYLASIDDRWEDSQCGSCYCDMSNVAGSSPESLAVLAAIVGAIAARRRRT